MRTEAILAALAVAGTCLLSAPVARAAAPAPTTVLGLPLGEPFAVPPCPRREGSRPTDYVPPTEGPCYTPLFDSDVLDPNGTMSVSVKLPAATAPSFVRGMSLVALVIDGRLEGIGFNSTGHATQQRVLDALTEKFGPPDAVEPKTMGNRMGARFEAFEAIWIRLPGLSVRFDSVTSRIDSGLVNVDTTKGLNWRSERLKRLSNGTGKL